MSYQITTCSKEEVRAIIEGINDYNLNLVPQKTSEFWATIELVVKDHDNQIIGGLLGEVGYWEGLEIKILWVKEELRGKGLGSELLQKAEEIAIQKGASVAILDTFDFQAPDFYIKNGYTVFGELDNFPTGHKRFYLSKKLT